MAIKPKTFVADSPATFVPDDAPAEATASTPNPTSHRYDSAPNQWGWMGPVGMTVGGMYGGPQGAALLGGYGTYLDQQINTAQHTPYGVHPGLSGNLQATGGVAGNMLLGGASEAIPRWAVAKLGGWLGPHMYKAALHVDPTLSENFPKVNIPDEAWAQGAPEISPAGVQQSGRVIAERAAEQRRLLNIAQSAHREGRVWQGGHQTKIPATVQRQLVFDLPMTDPQAGAMPSVPRRFPQQGVEPVGVSQNRMPSQAQEVGGPNQNVWTEWRPGMPVESQVPRTVLPNPVQQVTHTVNVPGTRVISGTVDMPQRMNVLNPNVRDLFRQSPQLKKLILDVGKNLEGAKDQQEIGKILGGWFKENGGKQTLNDLAVLARKAGAAGDWVHPSNAGGVSAQNAVSPNSKLLGKQLRQAIIRYIDNQAESVGITGGRAARQATQRAIAVNEAVHDASLRGTEHVNASGITEKAGIINRALPPRVIGNLGAYFGGMRPMPTNNPFGNFALHTLPQFAGWTGVNAARMIPYALQRPAGQ